MFTLREINCMERELFGYLDFALVVHRERLDAFVAYWAYEWALRSPPGTTGLPTRASSPNSSSSDTFDSNSRFTAGVKRRLSASANAPASEERHRDKMAALAAHSLLRPTFQPLSVPIQAQFSNSNSQSSWSTSERPMWAHRASDDNTSMSSSQCPSPYFQPTDGSSSSSSSEISTPVMTSPDQSVDTPYTDMPCAKTIAHDLSQAKAIQDLYHTLMPCPQWASPV